MKTISLIDLTLRSGRKLTKKNFWLIFLFIVTIFVIQWLFALILSMLWVWYSNQELWLVSNIIVNVISLIIWIAINIWRKNISLEISQNWHTKYNQFFKKILPLFLKFLWAMLLYFVAMIILFILPILLFIVSKWFTPFLILAVLLSIVWVLLFIIFAIRVQFFSYLIIDKNYWPYKAIKQSREITKWHFRELLWFCMSKFVILMLWAVALWIWLLRAIPTNQIATADFYKKISWSTNEPVIKKPILITKKSVAKPPVTKKNTIKKPLRKIVRKTK